MAIPILMPSLSPTMTEGSLAKWCKNVGDEVKPGDIIAEVETDKATMEVESIDEGILERVLFSDGTEGISVNSLIAILKSKNDTEKDVKAVLEKHGVSDNLVHDNSSKAKIKEEIKGLEEKVPEINQSVAVDSIEMNNGDNKKVIEKSTINNDLSSFTKSNNKFSASPLAKRMALHNNIDLKN
ncbi:MAG TPA: pyruvate dehydrogenase complex dihydrolipoamide acetyltransferase, partial [Alphaproteobacteria bacterium]|nr:pyruvate dehydrogenase complex dihydrolipoamide acetyltransferase [Alphaproteobacteria bacterium]